MVRKSAGESSHTAGEQFPGETAGDYAQCRVARRTCTSATWANGTAGHAAGHMGAMCAPRIRQRLRAPTNALLFFFFSYQKTIMYNVFQTRDQSCCWIRVDA
jgi:hypothetical protein